jgi:hypothetical protein
MSMMWCCLEKDKQENILMKRLDNQEDEEEEENAD